MTNEIRWIDSYIYKSIDLKMLIVYIETTYFTFIAQYKKHFIANTFIT